MLGMFPVLVEFGGGVTGGCCGLGGLLLISRFSLCEVQTKLMLSVRENLLHPSFAIRKYHTRSCDFNLKLLFPMLVEATLNRFWFKFLVLKFEPKLLILKIKLFKSERHLKKRLLVLEKPYIRRCDLKDLSDCYDRGQKVRMLLENSPSCGARNGGYRQDERKESAISPRSLSAITRIKCFEFYISKMIPEPVSEGRVCYE